MSVAVKLEPAWKRQQFRSFPPLGSALVPTILFPRIPPPVVTVTVAVLLWPPLEAVTVYGPPAALPAVKSPLGLIVPPPVTVHANPGWVANAVPNWSLALAVNCWVAPLPTLALAGDTAMLVAVWVTVILTLLVTVPFAWSLIVTWNA
jgi:hypothetical protein